MARYLVRCVETILRSTYVDVDDDDLIDELGYERIIEQAQDGRDWDEDTLGASNFEVRSGDGRDALLYKADEELNDTQRTEETKDA